MNIKLSLLTLSLVAAGTAFADYVIVVNEKENNYEVNNYLEKPETTGWVDVDPEYDCTVPTPLVSEVYKDTSFTQSHTCKQNQSKTDSIYYVYDNGERILKSEDTVTQIITVPHETTTIGSFLASSCKEILNSSGSTGSGNYTIYPSGSAMDAYCDMEIDGGGWTLVGRSGPTMNPARTDSNACGGPIDTSISLGNFGWVYATGSLSNESEAYSNAVLNKNIDFNEVLFGDYSSGKTWGSWVYKHNLSRSKLLSLGNSTEVIGYPTPIIGGNTNFGMTYQVGAINKEHFFLRDSTAYSIYGIMKDGWYSCYGNGTRDIQTGHGADFGGNVNFKPAMIFVK